MADHLPYTDATLSRRVADAETMFQRTLVAWASDVLELRRRDLLIPVWKHAIPAHSSEAQGASQGDLGVVPMNEAA
jgi:hypothetical protein